MTTSKKRSKRPQEPRQPAEAPSVLAMTASLVLASAERRNVHPKVQHLAAQVVEREMTRRLLEKDAHALERQIAKAEREKARLEVQLTQDREALEGMRRQLHLLRREL